MSAERGTYNDKGEDALDKNPYHATRVPSQDSRDHKVLYDQAKEPQFSHGVDEPGTAPRTGSDGGSELESSRETKRGSGRVSDREPN